MRVKKRKFLLVVVIFLVISISAYSISHLRIYPCSIKCVKIYKAINFQVDLDNLVTTINGKSLYRIIGAINSSDRIRGKLDVRMPDYIIHVEYKNGSINESYLWLSDMDTNGLWMKGNNNWTGYRISKKNNEELVRLIK